MPTNGTGGGKIRLLRVGFDTGFAGRVTERPIICIVLPPNMNGPQQRTVLLWTWTVEYKWTHTISIAFVSIRID